MLETRLRERQNAGSKNEEVRRADEAISWSAIKSRLAFISSGQYSNTPSLFLSPPPAFSLPPVLLHHNLTSLSSVRLHRRKKSRQTGRVLTLSQFMKENKPSFSVFAFTHTQVLTVVLPSLFFLYKSHNYFDYFLFLLLKYVITNQVLFVLYEFACINIIMEHNWCDT